MSYGPDTPILLERLEEARTTGELDISHLNIHSVPELPPNLTVFYCRDTSISVLPPLPPNLYVLCCSDTLITTLPRLPHTLEILGCDDTPIRTIPFPIPDSLEILSCSAIEIDRLPLPVEQERNETFAQYIARWRAYEESFSRERALERCREFKEEIMMKVWHPDRIQCLMDAGGMKAVEDFMG